MARLALWQPCANRRQNQCARMTASPVVPCSLHDTASQASVARKKTTENAKGPHLLHRETRSRTIAGYLFVFAVKIDTGRGLKKDSKPVSCDCIRRFPWRRAQLDGNSPVCPPFGKEHHPKGGSVPFFHRSRQAPQVGIQPQAQEPRSSPRGKGPKITRDRLPVKLLC